MLGSVQYYLSFLQCFFVKSQVLLLQTHVYLFQFYKKTDANGRISQWEMFYKKSVLFCHVSMICTLDDLFYKKRLFSQGTTFFSDYFTRDKNGRNSFSKEFSCSCAINKYRTGTLCRTLSYSAEHLKMPGNYSIGSYLLKIEKKSIIFSGSKQTPQRNTMLSQENM